MSQEPYSELDRTLVSLPDVSSNEKTEKLNLKPEDTLIKPGDRVGAIYQLLRGRIDMVRHLGTPKEERTSYERADEKDWAPILGGRYFFNGARPSSMYYLAMTPCTVIKIGPAHIERMYYDGNVVNLIRDIIRCSDFDTEEIRTELATNHAQYGYSGFNIDNLSGLLRYGANEMVYTAGAEDTRGGSVPISKLTEEQRAEISDRIQVVNDEYIRFSRDMLFQLLGDQTESNAERTSIKLMHQPRL
ncbi:MAG: hypothetical protein WC866_04135 [Patescibacteria group bacterium]|jgi:hypothetical protein